MSHCCDKIEELSIIRRAGKKERVIAVDDVTRTVQGLIATYPEKFRDRTNALHYILCRAGNGFNWYDGGVINTDPSLPWKAESVIEDGERVFSAVEVDSLPGDTGVILRDRWKGYVDELSEVVASADELAKVSAPLQKVYPQDEYSVLMRVEDSDDEIWLKACREMADLVSEHGWVVDKETLPMLYDL